MTNETIAYTIPGAVEATGLTRTRIYVLMGEGLIEAIKCGRRTLIRAESLRNYIEALPVATIRRAEAA
jgi:hypothetical protein